MKIALILCQLLTMSIALADQKKIVCFNKEYGKRPLSIELNEKTAVLSFEKMSCTLDKVDYNPVSSKYKGWIRYANKNTHNLKTYSTVCKEPMSAYFNQNIKSPSEFPDMDWISVSVELQRSGKGILQLGYENLWDPGAGGTLKTMLGCFLDKN